MPPPTTTQTTTTSSRGSYETDTRWTSIDAYTMSHLHPPSRPNHPSLLSALQNSTSNHLPDIACPPPHGKFLALQCRLLNARHALEVGTLGGYSALWLATENPGLKITTIEYSPAHAAVARENIRVAGVAERVEVVEGRAMDVLPRLNGEIEKGQRERFEFVFIDADKLNNYNYFDWAVKMCGEGACVVVDNIVSKGKLAMEEEAGGDEMVRGARDCVERVGKDDRVDAVVLQTVGEKDYDGFLMAVVK